MCTPIETMRKRLHSALKSEKSQDFIKECLRGVFKTLGLSGMEQAILTDFIIGNLATSRDLEITELAIFQQLKKYRVSNKTVVEIAREMMTGRAQTIFDQVRPYILPEGNPVDTHLLDYGCGDGQVSMLIREHIGLDVTSCDIIKYLIPDAQDLKFCFIDTKFDELFSNHQFDIGIMTNVAHHEADNEVILQRLARVIVPGGRLVVIETVPCHNTPEEFDYTFVFDYIYNRLFHYSDQVPVPGTYETIEGWIRRFEAAGFTLEPEGKVELGYDQPLVPDFHVLYVFRRNDN